MEEIEIWKPLKNHEEFYMVSNLGRVKSLPRKTGKGHMGVNHIFSVERIRKLNFGNGYFNFSIDTPFFKEKSKGVARAVLETFVPIPEEMLKSGERIEVNHIDSNKINNRLENLEWVTAKGNKIHFFKSDVCNHRRGENLYNASLKNEEVKEIKKEINNGKNDKELAEKYNVSRIVIYLIRTGRNYKHITI